MSEKEQVAFKDWYNLELITRLAERVEGVYSEFMTGAFIEDAARDLAALEMKERAAQIRDALIIHLPEEVDEVLRILVEVVERATEGGVEGMGSFEFMPVLDVVAEIGLDDVEASLDAIGSLTHGFSGEFAIRPFILAHQDVVMARMEEWASAESWHQRRLASEGSRPRLPWGRRLGPFVEDPEPLRVILDELFEDEELIVRRSVANSLNDISKDNPEWALALAGEWWDGGSEEARWTVKHGLRTLIKAGDEGALGLLGYRGGEEVVVEDFAFTSDVVVIGESTFFSFELVNDGEEEVAMMLDYVLHRALKNGKEGRKVFKLKKGVIGAGERLAIKRKLRVQQFTTRTYYPGEHAIELMLNGRSLGRFGFEVVEG